MKTVTKSIEERIQDALQDVKPHLEADGGDIEFIGVEDGIVKVKLKGACANCPMSTITTQWGIQNFLKRRIPEIVKVVAV